MVDFESLDKHQLREKKNPVSNMLTAAIIQRDLSLLGSPSKQLAIIQTEFGFASVDALKV
jgi:hypothetical protein